MTEEMIKETIVEEQVSEPEVDEAIVEEIEEQPTICYGFVDNCARLNVRTKPHPAARVVTILNADTELIIDEDKSTADWYSVREADGSVYGFCMKKFITII